MPEFNYEGQFAELLTGIAGCAMQRFKLCVPGPPAGGALEASGEETGIWSVRWSLR